jgi:hypothetical protein
VRQKRSGLADSVTSTSGSHQVLLLFLGELRFQVQVEELDRILQRQEPAVVQVRRAILDAA